VNIGAKELAKILSKSHFRTWLYTTRNFFITENMMTTLSSSMKTITAAQAQPGQWLVYSNPRMNQRVVEVEDTRDGGILIRADYGNGGEPGTLFFERTDTIQVADSNET
jgi:hypothetical protein